MAPLLDFELLMGEDRKDIWRDLCIKDAQTTADVSLVSRDHAQDPTYFIDVHSLVLLRHDWFKVLLGGEYAEGNGGAEAPAEGSYIPRMPDETKFRRRKVRLKQMQRQETMLTLASRSWSSSASATQRCTCLSSG
jgi:hypothetical protein